MFSLLFKLIMKLLTLKNVARITLNLEIVFLALMMIQMVENFGHSVSLIVLREAFAMNHQIVMFVIITVDDMHCHKIISIISI